MTRHRCRWSVASLCLTITGAMACSDAGEVTVPEAPADGEATVELIDDALTNDGAPPDGRTAAVYAEVGADHLAEFARHSTQTDPPSLVEGDIVIGSVPATEFLALGMATDAGRERLVAAHARVALDIAIAGVAAERDGTDTPWEAELAKLDAIVAAAQVLRDGVSSSDANEVTARAQDDQRTVVATAHLVVSLRAEAAGTPGAADQRVLDVAEAELSASSLSELREMAAPPSDRAGGSDGLADLVVGSTVSGPLAEDIDGFREVFAGREELPVEADQREVSTAYREHLDAALQGSRGEEE